MTQSTGGVTALDVASGKENQREGETDFSAKLKLIRAKKLRTGPLFDAYTKVPRPLSARNPSS